MASATTDRPELSDEECPPGEAFQVAAEARAYLTDRGVSLAGKQQTKTRTALRFFSKGLTSEDDGKAAREPTD